MASRQILLQALQRQYDRLLFAKEVLNPVFEHRLSLYDVDEAAFPLPSKIELKVIQKASIYAAVTLDDHTEVLCYEIVLQPNVRLEQSKVAIQRYVRKLLTTGQAALINFVSPKYKHIWRFTLVAKDSDIIAGEVKEKTTHPKRYTYLVEADSPNRTMSERLEWLSNNSKMDMATLIDAFSVEELGKTFFKEYKEHYLGFVEYLTGKRMVLVRGKWEDQTTGNASPFLKSVFNGNEKHARDFCKKLLGRVVFLYFVQKKRWLGASTTDYIDGPVDFIYDLFNDTGGDERFFPHGLTDLFFNVLNKERSDDDYITPVGKHVKIPYLNGGLFTRDAVDEILRKKGDIMTFPPGLFSEKEHFDNPKDRGFLDFLNAYNFTIYEDSPDDHTVAVNPIMLGEIFENLLEDNKDKGTYYTPPEIVSYMCRESLTEYLTSHLSEEFTLYKPMGKDQVELFGQEHSIGQLHIVEQLGDKGLNREDVEAIVKHKDINKLTPKQLHRINDLLDSVKICDPAIGSGAFPMGLVKEIFDLKEVISYELGLKWEPAHIKETIIQDSIYGVDIEKGAVDIARLRFWLYLIVDRDKPKALPNLDYKIVQGNSLISKFGNEIMEIDWNIRKTGAGKVFAANIRKNLQLLSEKQKGFYSPEQSKNPVQKKKKKTEIRNLKLEILENQIRLNQKIYNHNKAENQGQFFEENKRKKKGEVIEQNFGKLLKLIKKLKADPDEPFDHFDWKLDFPEVLNPQVAKNNFGFHIVIGNPPYVQLQKDGGKLAKMYEGKGYETFVKTGDIYSLFYEKGFGILQTDGILTYITSNKWMRAGYGKSTRKFFLEKTSILQLIDIGDTPIFENATTYTNILIGKNNKTGLKPFVCDLSHRYQLGYSLYDNLIQGTKWEAEFSEDSYLLVTQTELQLKLKAEEIGIPLENWNTNIYRGVLTGFNDAFIIDENTFNILNKDVTNLEILNPVIRGKDIKKYKASSQKEWLIGSHNGIKSEGIKPIKLDSDYHSIYIYLDGFGNKIKTRSDQGSHWSNLRNCSYFLDFYLPKIIWAEIVYEAAFYYDESGLFVEATGFIMTGKNLKYLLAVLNSKPATFLFRRFYAGGDLRGQTFRYKKAFLNRLPIPALPEAKIVSYLETLVDYIQLLKKQKEASSLEKLLPTYFEQIVDGIVYDLYFPGLLKQHNRDIIQHIGKLPAFEKDMSDADKMEICQSVFKRLDDKSHPVRNNLFYMDSIPEIALIEGKETS